MSKPKKQWLMHEVFEEVQNAATIKQREVVLNKLADHNVKTMLQLNFNPSLKLDLPEGIPPFTPDSAPDVFQPASLKRALSRLKICTKASPTSALKKEKTFIGILESIHPKDAEILCSCKDKKLTKIYSKVTKKLVESVLPQLIFKEKE